MDSIAIEHYLTKIHTWRRKERMSLHVQKYKQILTPLLLVVNSLTCLARLARLKVPRGHMPTNYIRLVPWYYPPLQILKCRRSDFIFLPQTFILILIDFIDFINFHQGILDWETSVACMLLRLLLTTAASSDDVVSRYGLFSFHNRWSVLILINFVPFPLSSPRQMRLMWLVCCQNCCQQQQALVAAVAFVNGYDEICVFSLLSLQNQSTVAMVEQHSIHLSCQRMLLCTELHIVWSGSNLPLQVLSTPRGPCRSWR